MWYTKITHLFHEVLSKCRILSVGELKSKLKQTNSPTDLTIFSISHAGLQLAPSGPE